MSELIVGDDEHEHWWVLTAPRLVVSGGGDNELANVNLIIDEQFKTPTRADQAEYFWARADLDFVRNQAQICPKFVYCVHS